MSNTDLITATETENMPVEYKEALALHNRILANGQIAVQAIVDFSLELKEMRDKKLFTALGYGSFDDYVEKAVGLKKRQAYNYIRAVERLGIESMQANAHLGITKLQLIANVASEEREEFIEANQVEDMSTKQLEEAIAELQKAKEQISFLEDKLHASSNLIDGEEETDISSGLKEEYNSLAKEFEKLKDEVEERKRSEKEVIKKAKVAVEEKLRKELEDAVKKSKAEGIEEATAALKHSFTALEQEKREALEKATALEKQLAVSNNQSSLMIAFLFEQINDSVQKITQELSSMNSEDKDKYEKAVSKFLNQQAELLSR